MIGFIGAGNMATALIGGIIKSGLLLGSKIAVSDPDGEKTSALRYLGVHILNSNIEVVKKSDIIILSVKPNIIKAVLEEIKNQEFEGKTIVSIAAGISVETIKSILGRDVKVVRTMPNTPALAQSGMTVISYEDPVTEEDAKEIEKIFQSVGETHVLPEKLINAAVGLNGSGPAYVYMFIEAMGDAGVKYGLPRDVAYKLAAQTVLGSAKMVLESDQHPGALKDVVCSPGGTTIAAVAELEERGLRSAVIGAVSKCVERAEELGRG